jgi:hypothetical protein
VDIQVATRIGTPISSRNVAPSNSPTGRPGEQRQQTGCPKGDRTYVRKVGHWNPPVSRAPAASFARNIRQLRVNGHPWTRNVIAEFSNTAFAPGTHSFFIKRIGPLPMYSFICRNGSVAAIRSGMIKQQGVSSLPSASSIFGNGFFSCRSPTLRTFESARAGPLVGRGCRFRGSRRRRMVDGGSPGAPAGHAIRAQAVRRPSEAFDPAGTYGADQPLGSSPAMSSTSVTRLTRMGPHLLRQL